MAKRPVRMTRLIKRSQLDDRFDVEFWSRVSPNERLAAVWQMVVDAHLLNGGNEQELEFQRSVRRLTQRRRAAIRNCKSI